MKSKIPFLLICAIYISSVNGMFVPKEVKEYHTQKAILFELLNEKPIILEPTNHDIFEFNQSLGKNKNFDIQDVGKYLCNLILTKDTSVEKRTINNLMSFLSFKMNHEGDDAPATPNINQIYVDIFPELLDCICKTEPKDLILKAAWQILSTMPSLFDTFCQLGYIKNVHPFLFQQEFEKINTTKGSEYLNRYLSLMAKVVQTDFSQQDIVLARLVQKLGSNIGFLDSVSSEISEIPVFKSKLNLMEEKYKYLKEKSKEDAYEDIKEDTDAKTLEDQINLIYEEINKFKKEISKKSSKNEFRKQLSIAMDTIGSLNISDSEEDEKENNNTKQEETEK